jgi:hypothetical protein
MQRNEQAILSVAGILSNGMRSLYFICIMYVSNFSTVGS